ncbi:MAG: hypothetical protein AAF346_05490 [Pseudomonadota bacterium]
MQHQSTIVWLKIGAGLVVVFGFITALGAYPPTAGVLGFLVDMIKWPIDGSQTIAGEEFRLLSAVSGGVMVGWGLLIWLIAERLYEREPHLSRLMIMVSVGAWFVVDSLASIMAGAALNAVLNISFLVLFFVPMMGKMADTPARGEQR